MNYKAINKFETSKTPELKEARESGPGFRRVSEGLSTRRGKNTPVPALSLLPPGFVRKTALMADPLCRFCGGCCCCCCC